MNHRLNWALHKYQDNQGWKLNVLSSLRSDFEIFSPKHELVHAKSLWKHRYEFNFYSLIYSTLNFAFHLSSGSRGCSQIMTAYAYTLSCAQLPVKLKLRNVGHERPYLWLWPHMCWPAHNLLLHCHPGVELIFLNKFHGIRVMCISSLSKIFHNGYMRPMNIICIPQTKCMTHQLKLLLELWEFLKIRLPVEERKAHAKLRCSLQLARTRTLLDPRWFSDASTG